MAQIAAQMYTLRDFCKTEEGIIDACRRVKRMGYDGVQLSGVIELDGKETKKILDGEGLKAVVTHISLDAMENHTEAVIERHLGMDCRYAAIGGFFPKAEDWSEKLWLDFIDRYNAIGAKFADSGIKIGYHNHSHEFAKAGVRRPMDMLISRLDPTTTWIEIDTYWVAHGGSDPAEYIRRVAGRIPCVHFKDMVYSLEDRAPRMAAVGSGNIGFEACVAACQEGGTEYILVEQDNCYDRHPLDCLKDSYDYLHSLGLK